MTLRAIIIGTGWAGEGHSRALQAVGVEVVALCGRTPDPTEALAAKLGVKEVRFDWRTALAEFRPDLVTIATSAAPHREMAVAAAEAGCHVVCEKPLAVNAVEAQEMLDTVERAGVKHGYAATGCYGAPYLHVRTLLAQGLIGQVREIEYLLHLGSLPPTLPYSWFHQLKEGGGMLNNVFTHQLQQVLLMTGGTIMAAMGATRCHLDRAPVGPPLHDFRQLFSSVLTAEQAVAAEWRPCDSDFGYTVLAQLQLPDGQTATALFAMPVGANHPHPTNVTLHGTSGTLYLGGTPGSFWPNTSIQHFDPAGGGWTELVIPQEVVDALPPEEDNVQRQWNQFFKEFVADVRGEGDQGYPTFRDGWVAVEVMDIARSGRGWTGVPEHLADAGGKS
jgi:predicted dehydrogenase